MRADLWASVVLVVLTIAQTIHIVVKRRVERTHVPDEDRRRYDLGLERRFNKIEADLQRVSERMDRAGRELSGLATKLQQMPNELKREFLDLQLGEEYARQCTTDRQRLRDDMRAMWDEVRAIRASWEEIRAQAQRKGFRIEPR